MKSNWQKVCKAAPCPICGRPDWCMISIDGAVALCRRTKEGCFNVTKDGGFLHRLIEKPRPAGGNGKPAPRPAPRPSAPPSERWKAEHERLRAALTDERLAALADATGVPVAAWALLSPGWAAGDDLQALRAGGDGWAEQRPDGAWVMPERDADGHIVGLSLRAVDGRKGFPAGAKRGLIVPTNWADLPDPVLIVEGASDVAACCALGLAAVGRPSNRGGVEAVAEMLDGRAVLVVGERDAKTDGSWPGRDGAKAVARQLAGRWGEKVQWSLPPAGIKDIRDWLRQRVADGLDPADADAMRAAGLDLLAVLQGAVKCAKPERRTQADHLVDLAMKKYRLGMSLEGDAFSVPRDSLNLAMMFRGDGSGLRMALAKDYRATTGKTPSAGALTDALTALEGMAQDAAPEPVALRVGEHNGGVVLDLGDPTGRAVVVDPGDWAVEAVSPLLFRRSVLTAALPEPAAADPSALLELRDLLNVDDETWPLIVGWLVAALIPGIPHPILLLGGEQGSGKSYAARLLLDLVDPSSAPLRAAPRDIEQWAVAASGSWCVAIDNVSGIAGWFSDALCKASTGDGLVRRKLYTDSDLAVLAFRRCVILTSIDPGALRGDLGDRLLLVDLSPIPDDRRRTEADLAADFAARRPRLLGALLSALSRTLAALPDVRLDAMPRMADFARVLAAADAACRELTDGRALGLFARQRRRIARDVVESDAVAMAIQRLVEEGGAWQGSAADLLARLTPSSKPKGWPANPRALVGRLRRLRPALAAVGILHAPPDPADKTRTHRIEKMGKIPPEPPEPPADRDSTQRMAFSGGAEPGGMPGGMPGGTEARPPEPPEPPADRPTENCVFEPAGPVSGRLGGMGGTPLHISAGNENAADDSADWGEV